MTGSGAAGDGGFGSEPAAVIAAIVAGIEPGLGDGVVTAAIMQVAPSRAQQRRLASALAGDPGLLTSGRPQGPPQIELLIRALFPLGAQRMILPGCARCGQPRRLVQCDGELRICSACDRRRRGAAEPCAACGNTGQVAYRDERGQPRCARCSPYDGPEPAAGVIAHVSGLSPGLDQARLREVIEHAVPQPFQQHQVLWELDRNPGLLTGDGAHGSPRVNVLIHALLAAGAAGIVAPACPSCSRTVRLSHRPASSAAAGAAMTRTSFRHAAAAGSPRWSPAGRQPGSPSAPAASARTRPTTVSAPTAGGPLLPSAATTGATGAAAATARRWRPAQHAATRNRVT